MLILAGFAVSLLLLGSPVFATEQKQANMILSRLRQKLSTSTTNVTALSPLYFPTGVPWMYCSSTPQLDWTSAELQQNCVCDFGSTCVNSQTNLQYCSCISGPNTCAQDTCLGQVCASRVTPQVTSASFSCSAFTKFSTTCNAYSSINNFQIHLTALPYTPGFPQGFDSVWLTYDCCEVFNVPNQPALQDMVSSFWESPEYQGSVTDLRQLSLDCSKVGVLNYIGSIQYSGKTVSWPYKCLPAVTRNCEDLTTSTNQATDDYTGAVYLDILLVSPVTCPSGKSLQKLSPYVSYPQSSIATGLIVYYHTASISYTCCNATPW